MQQLKLTAGRGGGLRALDARDGQAGGGDRKKPIRRRCCWWPPKKRAHLVVRVRKAGNTAQFVALSNNSAKSFITALAPYARGVMVTQVFPNPLKSSAPIAREMRKLAEGKKDLVLSHTAMEGFAAAKVLVEGIRARGQESDPRLADRRARRHPRSGPGRRFIVLQSAGPYRRRVRRVEHDQRGR